MYGFEWWWIFPLACFVLMLLCMIFFARKGRGFCCQHSREWLGSQDRISKLEQEIQKLKEN